MSPASSYRATVYRANWVTESQATGAQAKEAQSHRITKAHSHELQATEPCSHRLHSHTTTDPQSTESQAQSHTEARRATESESHGIIELQATGHEATSQSHKGIEAHRHSDSHRVTDTLRGHRPQKEEEKQYT